MRSKAMVIRFLSGRTAWLICCLSRQFRALLFPTECVQARERPYRLVKLLGNILIFWVEQEKSFLIQTQGGCTFCALDIFFGSPRHQAWVDTLRIWTLHRSTRQVVFLGKAVSKLVGRHRWALCLLIEIFLSSDVMLIGVSALCIL